LDLDNEAFVTDTWKAGIRTTILYPIILHISCMKSIQNEKSNTQENASRVKLE